MRKTLAVLLTVAVLFIWWSAPRFPVNAQGDIEEPVATHNGDVNGDGERNLADPIFLINWLFHGGPDPVAFAGAGDDGEDGAREYSNADFKGPYGNGSDGFLMVTPEGAPPIAIPLSAAGRFVADGEGNILDVKRTINLGGVLVAQQVGTGIYAVAPDGTVTVRYEVTTVGFTGTPPPGVVVPISSIETHSGVGICGGEQGYFVITGILDPSTEEPLLAVTGSSVMKRQ